MSKYKYEKCRTCYINSVANEVLQRKLSQTKLAKRFMTKQF